MKHQRLQSTLDAITFAHYADDYVTLPCIVASLASIDAHQRGTVLVDFPYVGQYALNHGCECYGDCDCGGRRGWFAYHHASEKINFGTVYTSIRTN